jgi:hypothetical protein
MDLVSKYLVARKSFFLLLHATLPRNFAVVSCTFRKQRKKKALCVCNSQMIMLTRTQVSILTLRAYCATMLISPHH